MKDSNLRDCILFPTLFLLEAGGVIVWCLFIASVLWDIMGDLS